MTTKRRRWKVWKEQRWAPKPCWVVTSPEYRECSFRTHAEALAYADRMARTVEIVLPRDNTVVPLPACMEKEEKPIMLHRWGEQIIIECTAQGVEEVIFIHDDELQPLALALLAHHYRSKR
ncbi:hypothetical protein [Corynebacterium sp. ACRQJ]|uniref:hypothetical protein n=1 Tax=Corynebacterium sp. ACRQJ TaxID=2918189 RepID=UPI001EF59F85|nr:hypothetical protein [Corynebacterium sp. ACRQJ]MCG7268407.1 hypothetical protein [Corynebacterium sp. ACRQJ]